MDGFEPKIGSAVSTAPQRLDFSFHGQGGEYFRIWIVNLLLSIVTLGIYSAWAKVRNLRYFYGNTELAGARFDFHGKPIAILIGRLITLACLVAYIVLSEVQPVIGLLLFFVLMLFSPWMVVRSLKFRLGNTSYRNLRFGFDGTVAEAYKYLLFVPLLLIPSFGLAFPFVQQRITRFLISNIRYGQARLKTDADAGDFYIVYGLAFAVVIALGVLVGILAASVFAVFMAQFQELAVARNAISLTAILLLAAGALIYLAILVSFSLVGQVMRTMLQQRVWSKAALNEHQFDSSMGFGDAVKLHLGNLALLVVTLGIGWAWVKVRTARFRIDNLTLHAQGGLAGIGAAAAPAGGAVGDELAEMFDFDFAL